jgi:hypothetical protein
MEQKGQKRARVGNSKQALSDPTAYLMAADAKFHTPHAIFL